MLHSIQTSLNRLTQIIANILFQKTLKLQDYTYLLQKKISFIENVGTATITTDRVKKFKSRTVFQVDVENLKSECNFKKLLVIKISSTIY